MNGNINQEDHMAESWRVVEHSWARTSIYCGETPICSLSIEETATEENQEDLELEMAKHARLIAAAPELLDALREILEVAKASLQYADSIPDEDRATINKANQLHEGAGWGLVLIFRK